MMLTGRDSGLQALEMKHMQLLLSYGEELEAVTELFHYNKDKPIVPRNAALHSGSIKWVRGLLERVEAPMEKIRMLNKLVLDTEEARVIFASQSALVQAMRDFEAERVKAWVSKVSLV
jgi:dynein heavy chain, axonemal